MNIILIGMKSSGKTTVGRIVAQKLGLRFIDLDAEITRRYLRQTNENLHFREIFKKVGKDRFRAMETEALQARAAAEADTHFVLATGGGVPLTEENRPILKSLGTVVFLNVAQEVLLPRIIAGGIPAFFPYPDDPARSLAELLAVRRPIYSALADVTVPCRSETPETIADVIVRPLESQ